MASSASGGKHRYLVKQVTKTNFTDALPQIKVHIQNSDFIAISSQKTGDFPSSSSSSSSSLSSSPSWRRILPIDTPETAYLKAKISAETFQLLQFAVCPVRVTGPKLQAFPYNFHLFPRDELHLGMPSYSFSCQTSFLTSMAREGLDFNVCINEGISYLSRVQESKAKERNPVPRICPIPSSLSPSVADSLFMGRIKSRVEHWRNACKNKDKEADGSLVTSLKRLILGDELYGSRPCLTIDVCSDRQVELVMEVVSQINSDLVPLVIPDKRAGAMAVRVVLTSSHDDKNLLMDEIKDLEEEENLKVRGFREVIDLISSSRKPVVTYNFLHDFAFIHSKFIAPLPPSLTEFMCSLRLAFPNVVDVNYLSKEVGPLRKAKSLSATLSYLKRQFFVPTELEIPQQADDNKDDKRHGINVLRVTSLFAKLCNLLKIAPDGPNTDREHDSFIKDYSNVFHPTANLQAAADEDVSISIGKERRKVSTDNIVFLWGFGDGVTASELKQRLQRSDSLIVKDFELRLVDRTCAVVVFDSRLSAEALVKAFGSGEIVSSSLIEMISNGLKGAGFEVYERACELGMWDGNLADSLEAALAETEPLHPPAICGKGTSEIYWDDELMIDLNDL